VAHLKKWRRAEEGAKIFGVFRVKNHDFTGKKIIFFPILGGGARWQIQKYRYSLSDPWYLSHPSWS
jgi:hypothetical protein